MTYYFKPILYGAVLWAIPFLLSIFFYDQSGELAINYWLFKLIMVIISTITIIALLPSLYKTHSDWIENSIVLFFVNIILDLIVLVGFLQVGLVFWFVSVAVIYLVVIPLTNYIMDRMIEADKKS